MNVEAQSGPAAGQPGTPPRRRASARHSRPERRSARLAARRRKTSRLLGAAGFVVVVVAIAVVLLVVLGGSADRPGVQATQPSAAGKTPSSSVSTTPAPPSSESALLVVEQDKASPAVVLLASRKNGGTVLAMPGSTLIKTTTPDGFKTLAELHAARQDQVLAASLGNMLGEGVPVVASAQWSDLRAAFAQVEPGTPLPAVLQDADSDLEPAAAAVMKLVGASGGSGGVRLWDRVPLAGGGSSFRAALDAIARSITAGEWSQAVLPGKLVEGLGFTYLEPDVSQAKALLAGGGTADVIMLEVENGSGVVGAAEQVGQLLAPLGYRLLPFRNAPDFPDVKRTQVLAAPDAVTEAERVTEMLGVDGVEQDPSLASGHITVVVGADLAPPLSTTTS